MAGLFLRCGFKLPNAAAMQKDVPEWEKCMQRYSGRDFFTSGTTIYFAVIWDATIEGRKAFLLTCSTFIWSG
jgi:hypothetical protein